MYVVFKRISNSDDDGCVATRTSRFHS
jgi:hypothetical protein